jgi:hypothetical protein
MPVDTLREICTDLTEKGFVVYSIVTHNASNEIAAVRELRQKLGVPVFHIPCLSDTTALASTNFVKDAFPLTSSRDFFGVIVDLRSLLPYVRKRDAVCGTLQPCETPWTSLDEFRDYGVSHRGGAVLSSGTSL